MAYERIIYDNEPDLSVYDKFIVFTSGGKDSQACILHLLDQGVDPSLIELWHQNIDGGGQRFFDWPCTEGYVRAFGEAFGMTTLFQWKEGGFEREMTRLDTPTAPTHFEVPEDDGSLVTLQRGGKGKGNTRMQFPQVSADLSVRWCSAYLKIDVGALAIRNSARLKGQRILVLTGERGEESTARSRYPMFERHRAWGKRDRRHVDHWRPILEWKEEKVWEIIKRYRVNPHPAYKLGYSRVSCMFCIFGNNDQWYTGRMLDEERFERIADYEDVFGEFHEKGGPQTIHRSLTVRERAHKGDSLIPADTPDHIITAAMREGVYNEPIILPEGEEWKMPAGAFGESGGPT